MAGLLTFWLVSLFSPPMLDTPEALLDRAITAVGGEQALKRLEKSAYLSEASFFSLGQPQSEVKLRRLIRLPDAMKIMVELSAKDKKQITTYVLRGKRGWLRQET